MKIYGNPKPSPSGMSPTRYRKLLALRRLRDSATRGAGSLRAMVRNLIRQ